MKFWNTVLGDFETWRPILFWYYVNVKKIFLFTFTNDQNLKVCEHASVLSFQLTFLPPNSQFI